MKELLQFIKTTSADKTQQNSPYGDWYETCDFFMLRTPVYSLDRYFKIISTIDNVPQSFTNLIAAWGEVANDPVVREALLVASPSLVASLDDSITKNNLDITQDGKRIEKIIRSLMKYYIRMTTRTTPFGLFSGVSAGSFGSTPDLNIGELGNYKKRVRPDMTWICKLVEMLENDQEVFNQLNVFVNPDTLIKGNRLKLVYRPMHGLADEKAATELSSSILLSEVSKYTYHLANRPTRVIDLKKNLEAAFPTAEAITIDNYVRELLRQEYLISELRPPLMDCAPLDYIYSQLKGLCGTGSWLQKLEPIMKQLSLYQQSPVGQGESDYWSGVQLMNDIATVKNPLQVDLKMERSVVLPTMIKKDVSVGAELMARLTTPEPDPLQTYLNEFLEVYGTSRDVPITELFDEDWGLGIPEAYASVEQPPKNINDSVIQRDKILFQLFNNAIANGDTEIVLQEEQIESLCMNNDDTDAPESMDIYYSIHTANEQALQEGDYTLVLGASAGSSGAGKTFGRFLDLFDSEFHVQFGHLNKLVHERYPHAIFAEAVYLPQQARISNIMMSKNFSAYELTMGTNSSKEDQYTISISDLYVAASQDRFYIKSKKLNQEVMITCTNMLNHKLSPPIYRFLVDVSRSQFKTWSYFHWGALEISPFLPRLRYKNIIISAAQWRLGPESIGINHGGDQDWYEQFEAWRKKWGLPRYIYLSLGDNRLMLDMNHKSHLQELKKEYDKLAPQQELLLVELVADPSSSAIHGDGAPYMGEFVFSLLKKRKPLVQPIAAVNSKPTLSLSGDRVILPSNESECLYLKLYGVKERELDFIALYLEELLLRGEDEREWYQFAYFVRYVDPKPHIRLRFFGDPDILWENGLSYLSRWVRRLKDEGVITTVQIDTYCPEWERYGGPSIMKLADKVFAADSRLVTCILNQMRMQQNRQDIRVLAVLSICDHLECFGFSLRERIEWLDNIVDSKPYANAYRKLKNELLGYIGCDSQKVVGHFIANDSLLATLYAERSESIRQYVQHIYIEERNERLTNSLKEILASIIHMHLNRLLGVNRQQEMECMGLARHVLAHFLYRKDSKP